MNYARCVPMNEGIWHVWSRIVWYGGIGAAGRGWYYPLVYSTTNTLSVTTNITQNGILALDLQKQLPQ